MIHRQLFRKLPEGEIVTKVLKCFGLEGFDCGKSFTRKDLQAIKCPENLKLLHDELLIYYLPCKAKIYLADFAVKKCITVLRHIAKMHDHRVVSTEKYMRGEKILFYRLFKLENNQSVTMAQDDVEITFD